MTSATHPTSMLSDAFGALVVRVFGIALMFVSTTLTARMLGPAEYGTYSAALALSLLLATLAPMGTDRILVRNLSVTKCAEAAGRETAIAHLCAALVAALLMAGTVIAWLTNALVLDNSKWAQTTMLATILFVPLTVTYLRQWVAIPLIGTRRALMPEQTILPVVFCAALLFSSAAGVRSTALTAAILYAGVLWLIWAVSVKTKSLGALYDSAFRTLKTAGKLPVRERLREGTSFVTVAVGAIASQSCMPLVIAATCGFADTAYYALAMPFAAIPAIPLGVFNLTMIPRCTRHYQNGEFAEANHAVRRAATATFAVAAVISIAVWSMSPYLILILGSDYAAVCRLLPFLLLAVMVDCLTGPTIPVMQTMGMEVPYARALFAYIPVQLGLVYWFGNRMGIEGAATAYLAARCLWNIAVVALIFKIRGLIMLPYLSPVKALTESSSSRGDGFTRSAWLAAGCAVVEDRAPISARAA
jgi:O-antigen/teichoic acid export membrane protein